MGWSNAEGDDAACAHRSRDGSWTDLQLPLYSYLVRELLDGARPEELGYIAIGRDDRNLGFWNVRDWRVPKDECDGSDEALGKGLDVAREVVRRIRAGDFFELDGWQPYDEIFGAIVGAGLLGGADVGGDGDGAE